MRDGFLFYFLMIVLRRLPMLLVILGGIVFAAIRWRSSSRASLMTIVALVIYLIDFVLFNVFLYWFPQMTESWHLSAAARERLDWFIFFFEDFVTAAIIILLTAAAFTGRRQAPNASAVDLS